MRVRARQSLGVSAKWEVSFDGSEVGVGNQGGAAEKAFAFAALLLKNVPLSLFPAQNFP
jgi:hypothetical protein